MEGLTEAQVLAGPEMHELVRRELKDSKSRNTDLQLTKNVARVQEQPSAQNPWTIATYLVSQFLFGI